MDLRIARGANFGFKTLNTTHSHDFHYEGESHETLSIILTCQYLPNGFC